jgi:hypothetical protein
MNNLATIERIFRLTCGSGHANVAQRMTETLTPPKIFSPLDKRCHLPVEQTKDQRRTTFFGAVRNEAGNILSDEKNPRPLGRGVCQTSIMNSVC